MHIYSIVYKLITIQLKKEILTLKETNKRLEGKHEILQKLNTVLE